MVLNNIRMLKTTLWSKKLSLTVYNQNSRDTPAKALMSYAYYD